MNFWIVDQSSPQVRFSSTGRIALEYTRPPMHGSVAIICSRDWPLAPEIAERLRNQGIAGETLALDAVFQGDAVSVLPDGVVWQGHRLQRFRAVLVERARFAWPQPQQIERLLEDGAPSRARVTRERESRSLAISALEVAAETTRVINHPSTVHLVVSPATALHRLGATGLPVHPWRIQPAPENGDDGLVLDSVGRELRHEPGRPAVGQPALLLDAANGEVVSVCMVGRRAAGARLYADGGAWLDGRHSATLTAREIAPEVLATAARAAVALAVDLAVISVHLETQLPTVLFADAGPDLAHWNRALEGRVGDSLAEHLAVIVAGEEGVEP